MIMTVYTNTCEIKNKMKQWRVTHGRGRVRDEGEGIWLMGFVYIYEIESCSTIALRRVGKELWRGDGGDDLTNEQCKPVQNCHNEYVLIKMKK
jgi:hypothetical protein